MLCTRCSHPLASRADRCLRCFALDPKHLPPPVARVAGAEPRAGISPSAPVAPVAVSIASGPPAAVTMEFTDERAESADLHEAVTEPPDQRAPSLPARLLAWAIDLALLSACAAAHVLLAIEVIGPASLAPHGSGSPDYWLDLLLAPRLSLLWAALAACLAVSYSSLFAMLGARTPGMAFARLKLVTASGAPPTPAKALARAALSLASAAGLLGFTIALFDERGQTLHDKLAGTQVVPD